MYRAHLPSGASLQAASNAAYDFGTGDFTVMAMMESRQGGTLVARKGTNGGSGNGGFLLVVKPNGAVKFATDNGFGYYEVVTGPTDILTGNCHTVAGVRSGAHLSIFIDGLPVAVTAGGNATPPLNVNNTLPLTVGRTQQSQEPYNQFVGDVMNVSLWNTALSGDLMVMAAFARVNGSEPNLKGYWSLDNGYADRSAIGNALVALGPVSFEHCLHCVWANGDNHYTFCHISNMSDGSVAPATTVTQSRTIPVPAGAPAFGMAIMADQDVPAFPAGVTVSLVDPSGATYATDQNTDTVYSKTSGGQLWGLMVVNPAAGNWQVVVTAPTNVRFHLNIQTVPSAAVVDTCRQTLTPLYGTPMQARALMVQAVSLGGFWDMVTKVAVGVAVGVVATGAVVLSGGAALPAVVAGIGAFAVVEFSIAQAALPTIDGNSLPIATGQMSGMAGFTVAADKLLVLDANSDEATQIIYSQRSKKLYPKITTSTFNKVQSQLIGSNMTRSKVRDALTSFASGYVTAGGHGKPPYLMGWYAPDSTTALQEVIATYGGATFGVDEVKGKIFHFLACNCGYEGTATSPGLGRAMVAAGAVAFFGYKTPFIIAKDSFPDFCNCDIKIDLMLIAGKSCDQTYAETIALFDQTISRLRVDGNTKAAAALESNRNALVAPSTNAIYGEKTARLKIA